MIVNSIAFFMALLAISFFSCSKAEPEGNETLAKINDYKLSCCEFQKQLDREVNFEADLKATEEVRAQFLNQLIEEELLIQEAKKLELDRKEKFVQAMEHYWKSTLIRDLLEEKGEEIDRTITISQGEIESYYDHMKEEDKNLPPLSEIRDKIAKMLKKNKKRQRLKAWVAELGKTADLDINHELLNKGLGKK